MEVEEAPAPETDNFANKDGKTNNETEAKTPSGKKPRQYIIDRTNGMSKIDPDRKPPLFCCYAPPPVAKLPGCLEQNIVCESWGRIGCVPTDSIKMRKYLFAFGVFANIISFALTIFGFMASSQDFERLQKTSFSSGTVMVYNISSDELFATVKMDIGLRAVAFDNPLTVGEQVYNFDQFCNQTELASRYLDEEQCDSCGDVSSGLIMTLALSLVAILPSITTDVLRMYPNYDLNCQKFWGSTVSTFSLLMSLSTFLRYQNQCFDSFYDGMIYFDANLTALDDDTGAVFLANFDWKAGNGLICLFVATFIKVVDILANVLVPTPTITRNRKEQEEYEALSGEE
jgi:hypothetical protein